MPEGHTLHRLAREHTSLLAGRRITASSPQGRFAAGAARLDGAVVTGVEAHGKHIFYDFDRLGERLHVHLGIYGTFSSGSLPAPPVRGAVRLRIATAEAWADLRGPSACDLLAPEEAARILARLGPDPLRRDADHRLVHARIRAGRAPVGARLLDQTVVAGIGNVYRAEVLFRQGVSPFRPGGEVDEDTWTAIWQDVVRLMRAGVRAGRIVTTRPAHRPRPRSRPTREESFYVWRRSGLPCRVCGTPVSSAVLAARTIYWCPACQPG